MPTRRDLIGDNWVGDRLPTIMFDNSKNGSYGLVANVIISSRHDRPDSLACQGRRIGFRKPDHWSETKLGGALDSDQATGSEGV